MKQRVFTAAMIFILLSIAIPYQMYGAGQQLDQWLVLGPAQVPALEKEALGGNKAILNFKHLDISKLMPETGSTVPWAPDRTLHWMELKNNEFNAYDTGVLYLATYLTPSRWMETTLDVHNTNLGVTVYLDGKNQKERLLKDKISTDLTLTNEKHLLLLKVLLIKGETFKFSASLNHKENFEKEHVAVSINPGHSLKPYQILNVIRVNSLRVSPDGKRVAVALSQTTEGSGKTERWTDILDTASGKTIYSSKGIGSLRDFQWLGDSVSYSYTISNKSITSVFMSNVFTHQQTAVLENIENLSRYWWSPTYDYLVYCSYHEEKSDEDFRYVKEIPDRASDSNYRYTMTIYYPSAGASHQISDEESNYSGAVISPDGKRIVLTKNMDDYKNRPYNTFGYYMLDIKNQKIDKLFHSSWVNRVRWSPDSSRLLFTGGASSFNGIGNTLPKDTIPNDFDDQAFIYDPMTKKAEAISKQFDPNIDSMYWGPSRNYIYIEATEKSWRNLFKYSVAKKTYRRLKTSVDVISTIDFARNRHLAVYWGSGANVPYKLYTINLANGRSSLLKDYNRESFHRVAVGQVKDWNYKTPAGKTVIGRLHFPPDFDANKKYPCIVYYYGGTSPVTRDFAGRYPKNWYAANGYIVYVLQPSGAVGFGQENSAIHVNDWGKVTSEEVIGAVKQLVKEHTYIDAKRIGAMGASYGGFLTQYIATQTDIFAAYISHAGISALSSYWGVGDWGYSYSAVATADSFPWNRKDIYVGHSPLFMADRITSPLLLLHGAIDNNVPPGESYQMFAALKLLGKDVALVTYKGQKHWILEYKKRLHWMRTIIAWWDKYLKKQPQHWEHLYE